MRRDWTLIAPSIALLLTVSTASAQQPEGARASRVLPFDEWVKAGEVTQIPWKVQLFDVRLRPDQRLEQPFQVWIGGRQFAANDEGTDVYFIARISDNDGRWLGEPGRLSRHIEKPLARSAQLQFGLRPMVQPGEYILWVAVYDAATDRRSVARRPFRVEPIKKDFLEGAFNLVPAVEFPRLILDEEGDWIELPPPLSLQVGTRRPIEVELIANLGPPEQWMSRSRVLRQHQDLTAGYLAVLSQLEIENGIFRITGLDLVSRNQVFDSTDAQDFGWQEALEYIEELHAPKVSKAAFEGQKLNGQFFRQVISEKMARPAGVAAGQEPIRVFIILSNSVLFRPGTDLRTEPEPACSCRVYHLRYRQTQTDVFDDLARFLKPFKPKTYNLYTPWDFRRAVGEILSDLRSF